MKVIIATTDIERDDAYFVRRKVFVEEQNVPENLEIDEHENEATHFVMYYDAKPIGAGRIRIIDGFGKIERVCVLSSERNKKAGKLLMEAIEDFARQSEIVKTKLNAQTHAEAFYKKLGYETVSDIFMDADIPHVTMIKTL